MPTTPAAPGPTGRELAGTYTRTLVAFLLGMAALWLVGIEGIYGHPTPFYALYLPVFTSPSQPLCLAALMGMLYWGWSQRYLARSPGRFQAGLAAWTAVSLLFGVQTVYEYLQLRSVAAEAADTHRAVMLRQIPVFTVFVVALLSLLWFLRRSRWYGQIAASTGAASMAGPYAQGGTLYVPKAKVTEAPTGNTPLSQRETVHLLLALFAFAVAFPFAVAFLRGGLEGITQAYARSTYEYIGDIGKTPSIRSFFAQYNEIHPYLSMHAKVHPPGPVVVLWLMSPLAFFMGDEVLGLSLMTILFGALGVIPLYFWVRELVNERTATVASMLYVCMPTIVLFTATSGDILFTPFTLFTLCAFERALRRGSVLAAVAAGIGYACMSLLSFSLIGVGIYFALAGLWRLREVETRKLVFQTAAIMVVALLGTHAAVFLWSGFDVIECFILAKAQFDMDQHHLDLLTPRLPAWTYRILNPMCWFYFAGIPVSLLFLKRLMQRDSPHQAVVWQCFLALIVLNLLYLARGEGERSAMYLMPFLAVPAAMMIDDIGKARHSPGPLAATLAFLVFQCWFTEMYFYTYW